MRALLLAVLLLAACSDTKPSSNAPIALGPDGSGAACTQQTQPNGEALIYCGDLQQPSGRVMSEAVAAGASADQLAASGPWRSALDKRFDCHGTGDETLFGTRAATIACMRRISGWPHEAVVVEIGGRVWFGDSDPATALVLRRGIGVAAGVVRPDAAPAASIDAGLAARRLAAQAVSSRDIRDYEALMIAGVRANLTENFAASEAAFRQAAALQLRGQGPDAPSRADPLIHQALQLSNLGSYAASDTVFATAEHLLNAARDSGRPLPDETVRARLALYRGLSLLNQDKPADALVRFAEAERGFTPYAPPGQGITRPPGSPPPRGLEAVVAGLAETQLFQDPIAASAVLGLVSARRSSAMALLSLGRVEDSARENAEAQAIADSHGMAQAVLEARILRTGAMIAKAQGEHDRSLALLTESASAFNQVFPTTRPVAETELLRAASLFRQNREAEAVAGCKRAVELLQRLRGTGMSVDLMMPCLDGFEAAASSAPTPEAASALWADLFAAAQLAQSSITGTQIAEAAARLSEAQRDTRVGEAIRRRETTGRTLEDLYRTRDEAEEAQRNGANGHGPSIPALNQQIEAAEVAEADAEAALGVASPNYRQLVEAAVAAPDVFAALRRGEAMAAIVLGEDHGWTLMLRDGRITAARIAGGRPRMAELVKRVRASMAPAQGALPPAFDTAAAAELYQAILAPADAQLAGVDKLVVAPSGPLLSIPFGLLLTGPAGSDLASAPWLVQQMTVAHVPAPANFVSLRRVAGGSRAHQPWAGFGDPVPVSLKQATATFPAAECHESAMLLSELPRLPGAGAEVEQVRRELGGSSQDEKLGPAFTRAALQTLPLKDFRVLHFATHGLLPTDLSCESEPAIMLSESPAAPDASGALLTASQIAQWDLDADAVILSACNTSGPDGRPAGESLSGLARSFFFAGARALLVTHWPVNDQVTTILVAGTMQRLHDDPAQGLAAALAGQQRALLGQAQGPLAALAHPFYWAPLALIGDGSATSSRGAQAAL
jgi:CHAT domain-containing protein